MKKWIFAVGQMDYLKMNWMTIKIYSNNLKMSNINISNIRKYFVIIFFVIYSTFIYSQNNIHQKEIFLKKYDISILLPNIMDTIPNFWISEANLILMKKTHFNGGFYLTKNDYPFTYPYILYTYYTYDVSFLNSDNETRLIKLAKKYDFYDKQLSISYETEIGVFEFDSIAFGKPYIDINNNFVYYLIRSKQKEIDPLVSYIVFFPLEKGFLVFNSYLFEDTFFKNYKMFKDIFTSIKI
jgi:hypothetical protein